MRQRWFVAGVFPVNRQDSGFVLWRASCVATLSEGSAWGLIDSGAILTSGDQIKWVGEASQIPQEHSKHIYAEHNFGDALITPGLIDCHTHIVYGGHRAAEFEQSLNGASYEEIARNGGGIRSTVSATRDASDERLFELAKKRVASLMAEGVTTIEIKSGYGLTLKDERRSLAVARRLGAECPVSVKATYLAAHAVPPEFSGRADDYIDAVCAWLPVLAREGLVDAVDVFCENIAFSISQTRKLFEAARSLGIPVKAHAEQLSHQGSALLAAEFSALSCDHLEHLSAEGILAMRNAGTVAVLLPGAYYFLRDTHIPPISELRRMGVPIAIATDHNPGSSPTLSLLLMMNMACTLFRMTPEEALRGVTVNGARTLGMNDRGTLRAGHRADFVVWDIPHPRELAYWVGHNPCKATVYAGQERL